MPTCVSLIVQLFFITTEHLFTSTEIHTNSMKMGWSSPCSETGVLTSMYLSLMNSHLFNIGHFLCPHGFGPLFFYLTLFPCFADHLGSGIEREVDLQLGQVKLIQTEGRSRYTSLWSIYKNLWTKRRVVENVYKQKNWLFRLCWNIKNKIKFWSIKNNTVNWLLLTKYLIISV